MTKSQATKEARRRFGGNAGTRTYRCGGLTTYAGAKASRGCGHSWHLQPCPGGPTVYEVFHVTGAGGLLFRCIDVSGDSWEDCFARLDARREADRVMFENARAKSKVRR